MYFTTICAIENKIFHIIASCNDVYDFMKLILVVLTIMFIVVVYFCMPVDCCIT